LGSTPILLPKPNRIVPDSAESEVPADGCKSDKH